MWATAFSANPVAKGAIDLSSQEVKDFYNSACRATLRRNFGGGPSSRRGSSSCAANTPTSSRRLEATAPIPPDSPESGGILAALQQCAVISPKLEQTAHHERGR